MIVLRNVQGLFRPDEFAAAAYRHREARHWRRLCGRPGESLRVAVPKRARLQHSCFLKCMSCAMPGNAVIAADVGFSNCSQSTCTTPTWCGMRRKRRRGSLTSRSSTAPRCRIAGWCVRSHFEHPLPRDCIELQVVSPRSSVLLSASAAPPKAGLLGSSPPCTGGWLGHSRPYSTIDTTVSCFCALQGQLVAAAPRLTSLTLIKCPWLTDSAVKHLQHLPDLATLSLADNGNITCALVSGNRVNSFVTSPGGMPHRMPHHSGLTTLNVVVNGNKKHALCRTRQRTGSSSIATAAPAAWWHMLSQTAAPQRPRCMLRTVNRTDCGC